VRNCVRPSLQFEPRTNGKWKENGGARGVGRRLCKRRSLGMLVAGQLDSAFGGRMGCFMQPRRYYWAGVTAVADNSAAERRDYD
jgi:hypothetical protein